jgi:hypothetical protein
MTTTPGIAGFGNALTTPADLSLNRSWDPEDYGTELTTILRSTRVAYQLGTLITTGRQQVRFPLWTADPATQLVGENQAIPLTDPTLGEVVVQPAAFKSLTQVSNEALRDAEPAILSYLALGLANAIGKAIDTALFANTTSVSGSSNTLAGIESLSASYQHVTGAFSSLDNFYQARQVALAHNAILTDVVLAPDVATTLSEAKTITSAGALSDVTSHVGLFGPQGVWDSSLSTVDGAGNPGGSTPMLAGLRVHVSPQLGTGLSYAVDRRQIFIVERTGTEITSSPYSAFGSDAFQVRATHRIGFGFPNAAGIVKITAS